APASTSELIIVFIDLSTIGFASPPRRRRIDSFVPFAAAITGRTAHESVKVFARVAQTSRLRGRQIRGQPSRPPMPSGYRNQAGRVLEPPALRGRYWPAVTRRLPSTYRQQHNR